MDEVYRPPVIDYVVENMLSVVIPGAIRTS